MELKYCEACGGLWVRECGAGVVYCEKCQPKVDELPFQKKRPGRVRLPVGPERQHPFDVGEDSEDVEAAGGVACAR
jgi:hypothetical protein